MLKSWEWQPSWFFSLIANWSWTVLSWHQLCEIWRCYDNWHTYLVETAFKRIILWIEAFLKMAAIFDFHLYGDFFLHSTWWISFGSRITQQKFIGKHWLNIFHYWLSSQINAVICLKKSRWLPLPSWFSA